MKYVQKHVNLLHLIFHVCNNKVKLIQIWQLAVQLGIAFDVKRAAKNEEFMASVSRTAIVDQDEQLLSDIIDHARQRASYLLDMYNELRTCYAEQDGILSTNIIKHFQKSIY